MNNVNEALIKQINSGNELAFSILYKAYYVQLNTISFYFVNDEEISNEIVNDVFLKIWKKRETLMYPVRSYLIKTVRNNCIDFIRNQQLRQRTYEFLKERLIRSYQAENMRSLTPLDYVEIREVEKEIRKAITQLTPRCQQIFKAYFNEGKSAEEIALELNISISTVRVQMKNSNDKLRFLLKHLLSHFSEKK